MDGQPPFSPQPPPAPLRDLVGRVRTFCRREGLFRPDEPVLVMVSGGTDSLTLLHLLVSGLLGGERPGAVRALHVNHGLRGEESEADEALVREVCARWRVPLHVRRAPLDKGVGNVQERARILRQAAALDLAGDTAVALGHTLDDQVETLLYRLGRYGGLAALRAMRPREGGWVRPLLVLSREETQAYCRSLGQPFAVDRGNVDPGYARTRLREEVLPLLDQALPGFRAAAARTAEVAAEVLGVGLSNARAAAEQAAAGGAAAGAAGSAAAARAIEGADAPGSAAHPSRVWSAARLAAMDPALRRLVLWQLLEELPGVTPTRGLVLEAERALPTSGSVRVPLGAGFVFGREYGRVRVLSGAAGGPQAAAAPAEVATLAIPGEAPWGGLLLRAEVTGVFRAPDPTREAYLDARELPPSLTVRGRRPGDRLRILGAAGETSLQDLFVDRRVPASLREQVPVVLAGERIVWVGGLAVAEGSRMRRDSDRLVRLSIEAGGGGGR